MKKVRFNLPKLDDTLLYAFCINCSKYIIQNSLVLHSQSCQTPHNLNEISKLNNISKQITQIQELCCEIICREDPNSRKSQQIVKIIEITNLIQQYNSTDTDLRKLCDAQEDLDALLSRHVQNVQIEKFLMHLIELVYEKIKLLEDLKLSEFQNRKKKFMSQFTTDQQLKAIPKDSLTTLETSTKCTQSPVQLTPPCQTNYLNVKRIL